MGGHSTYRCKAWGSLSPRRPGTALLALGLGALLLAACQTPTGTISTGPAGTAATVSAETSNAVASSAETSASPARGANNAGKTAWLNKSDEELVGLPGRDISAVLGEPTHIRRDDPAEIWQYSGENCVLDFYLYRASTGMQVAYVEARDRRAQTERADSCMHALLQAGNPVLKTAEKTADASQ
jgi:hypothetical protein